MQPNPVGTPRPAEMPADLEPVFSASEVPPAGPSALSVTCFHSILRPEAGPGPVERPASARPGEGAATPADLREDIVGFIPSLRAFARSLTGNPGDADDLLQETLMRAIANIHQFTPGTNLKAWLFRIQRNVYYTAYRKRRRESVLLPEQAEQIVSAPQQEWSIKIRSMHEALERLPEDQREALLLVSGAGLSYEEAAELCGCALGTIKSRVSRARTRLLALLNVDDHAEFLEVDHPQP